MVNDRNTDFPQITVRQTDPSGYSYFIPGCGYGSMQKTYQNAVNG